MSSPHLSPEQRFWPKVDRRDDGECWPWLGSKNRKGYGRMRRVIHGRVRYFCATHIAWTIANSEPWPAGKMALHSCDNPSCVNPRHIRPGTHIENMADMKARNRPRGRYRRSVWKYPFNDLEIGESFLMPLGPFDDPTRAQLRIISSAGHLKPRKFSTRRTDGGIRVWRIADLPAHPH